MASQPKDVGILAMDIYFPPTSVQQVKLFEKFILILHNGLSLSYLVRLSLSLAVPHIYQLKSV